MVILGRLDYEKLLALAREGKRLKRDLDGILGELEAGGNDVASNVMFYETIIVL